MKNYVSIETSEGPIQILLMSDMDIEIIIAYGAAISSIWPKPLPEYYTTKMMDTQLNRMAAFQSVKQMFIKNYFLYGASWDVDEDSMTDEERQLWEEAAEQTIDRFEALDEDEMEEFINHWEELSSEESNKRFWLNRLEDQLETI
jgi:hypothetical protein